MSLCSFAGVGEEEADTAVVPVVAVVLDDVENDGGDDADVAGGRIADGIQG